MGAQEYSIAHEVICHYKNCTNNENVSVQKERGLREFQQCCCVDAQTK